MVALAAYVLVAVFAALSGLNDGGNLLAVLASSRILPVAVVIVEIGTCMTVAPFLIGTRVAHTIGAGILPLAELSLPVVTAALVATLVTLLACYASSVPTSITFALVGAMGGVGAVMLGMDRVHWASVGRVAGWLVLSVMLAGVAGYVAHIVAKLLLGRASARAGRSALWTEIATSACVCIGYGANDAEKTLGLLALVTGVSHHRGVFHVAPWMVGFSTAAFLVGLLVGGWRVARMIQGHVFRIRPIHAVMNEFATAAVVIAASSLGGPVSTTQALDSSLVGVGASAHARRVRWRVVRKMAGVWIMTMPLAFVVGCVTGQLFVWGGYR
ncbi:inorganic phosphate transporter [Alicyclobacillus mali (ex Roth et al. 2021)]|uniref:inorganic phosphate transporter n=1 Tax=Alicyclobacillus mali (ex Roth et al. 2021) TaxID=1123961 RepID=UPI0008333251|nr:inorganic phosphate transporter [Alicyclobacillus mali (ex Roth et al. 2021)]